MGLSSSRHSLKALYKFKRQICNIRDFVPSLGPIWNARISRELRSNFTGSVHFFKKKCKNRENFRITNMYLMDIKNKNLLKKLLTMCLHVDLVQLKSNIPSYLVSKSISRFTLQLFKKIFHKTKTLERLLVFNQHLV